LTWLLMTARNGREAPKQMTENEDESETLAEKAKEQTRGSDPFLLALLALLLLMALGDDTKLLG
jgi:hypothetical protein